MQVVRVVGSLLPAGQPPTGPVAAAAAGGRSLQIVASFDAGCTALGVAPFGADLAVLAWGACSSSGSGDGSSASSSAVAGAGMGVIAGSSTAEGQAPAAGGSSAAAEQAHAASQQPPLPPPEQSVQQPPSSPQQQQPQQQPQQQQSQQLSLCFYSRSGQLLAADALDARCSAAQRQWHQLALLYPGDADLQLAAASASAVQQQAATPRGGSSAAGSGRSSPEKAGDGGGGAAQAGAADGGAAVQHAGSSGQHAEQQHGQPQAQQQPQQYKWWRDGEEPLYLVSNPWVSYLFQPCYLFQPMSACLFVGLFVLCVEALVVECCAGDVSLLVAQPCRSLLPTSRHACRAAVGLPPPPAGHDCGAATRRQRPRVLAVRPRPPGRGARRGGGG